MKTLIISGGNIDRDVALRLLKEEVFAHIIGVDGGLKFCHDYDIRPTRIVGDFDTLSPEILEWYEKQTDISIQKYNPVKDAADTQIAVELAIALGSTDITILGGTGTRLDHVIGNVHTLYLPLHAGIPCRLLDGHNRIRLVGGRCTLKKKEQYGQYFSLLPFTTEVKGVTIRGAKYPLTNYDFTVLGSGSLGVSNEIMEEQAEITLEDGILILIESKD